MPPLGPPLENTVNPFQDEAQGNLPQIIGALNAAQLQSKARERRRKRARNPGGKSEEKRVFEELYKDTPPGPTEEELYGDLFEGEGRSPGQVVFNFETASNKELGDLTRDPKAGEVFTKEAIKELKRRAGSDALSPEDRANAASVLKTVLTEQAALPPPLPDDAHKLREEFGGESGLDFLKDIEIHGEKHQGPGEIDLPTDEEIEERRANVSALKDANDEIDRLRSENEQLKKVVSPPQPPPQAEPLPQAPTMSSAEDVLAGLPRSQAPNLPGVGDLSGYDPDTVERAQALADMAHFGNPPRARPDIDYNQMARLATTHPYEPGISAYDKRGIDLNKEVRELNRAAEGRFDRRRERARQDRTELREHHPSKKYMENTSIRTLMNSPAFMANMAKYTGVDQTKLREALLRHEQENKKREVDIYKAQLGFKGKKYAADKGITKVYIQEGGKDTRQERKLDFEEQEGEKGRQQEHEILDKKQAHESNILAKEQKFNKEQSERDKTYGTSEREAEQAFIKQRDEWLHGYDVNIQNLKNAGKEFEKLAESTGKIEEHGRKKLVNRIDKMATEAQTSRKTLLNKGTANLLLDKVMRDSGMYDLPLAQRQLLASKLFTVMDSHTGTLGDLNRIFSQAWRHMLTHGEKNPKELKDAIARMHGRYLHYQSQMKDMLTQDRGNLAESDVIRAMATLISPASRPGTIFEHTVIPVQDSLRAALQEYQAISVLKPSIKQKHGESTYSKNMQLLGKSVQNIFRGFQVLDNSVNDHFKSGRYNKTMKRDWQNLKSLHQKFKGIISPTGIVNTEKLENFFKNNTQTLSLGVRRQSKQPFPGTSENPGKVPGNTQSVINRPMDEKGKKKESLSAKKAHLQTLLEGL